MEEKKPHWIHDEVEDKNSVTGKRYLVSCTCSEYGYHANTEKTICPQCKVRCYSSPNNSHLIYNNDTLF